MNIYDKLERKLKIAISSKNILTVKKELQKNLQFLKCPSNGKKRSSKLLLAAIHAKDNKMVELLVELGADVNFKKPLQLALIKGNVKCCEFLLKKGAKLTGAEWDETDHSPVEIALMERNNETRKKMLFLLFKYGLNADYCKDGRNLLHLLIKHMREPDNGAAEIAGILLDLGVPLDEHCDNRTGLTPLMYAIKRKNFNMVSFLIKKGADVNKRCPKSDKFPLLEAAKYNNVDVIELLLSSGADINATADTDHWTALHQACVFSQKKSIHLLLQKGIDLKALDYYTHETAFSKLLAEMYYNVSCIKIMIKRIAVLQTFDACFVSELDLNSISNVSWLRIYLNKCTAEIEQMKISNFYSSYSYYSVLKMSTNIQKLAKLTSNEEFVKAFNRNLFFPLYKRELQRIFNEAIHLKDQTLCIQSRLMKVFKNIFSGMVIRKLAENLQSEDALLD